MVLIETTITELVEYIDLWNNEYVLNMVFRGQHGKHAAWTVSNVLITGIEIAPGRVLCEVDNFDLQGVNNVARRVTHRLAELLHESFPVDDTPNASRVYGIMARQAARTLRVIPVIFADTSLDAETEADFKAHIREKNPDITEEELSSTWQDFCHLVEQQRIKREEQERQRDMTAEDAVAVWLRKVAGEEAGIPKYEKVGILFLAADPTDASRLRLGEEFREIQEKLKLAKLRDRFRLELPQLSVRPADISQALLDVQPQIVHFSGHGVSTGALCFEKQSGQTHLVQPDALAALFEQFANQVNCVLLNACYSETQAKAIAEYIEHVIGMSQAIGDKAAIAFAIGFYQALGAGRTIENAYKFGCVQIRLQGIPEHLTPVLIRKASTSGKPKNTVESETHRSSAGEKHEGTMRILYLEDEPQLVESLPIVLQSICPELEIIGTTDITEALARIAEEDFDGVLIDCSMPPTEDMSAEETEYGRLTGVVVAQRIKAVKPDVPIVALTVARDPLLRQKMRNAGMVSVISKPAEVELITDTLQKYVRKRKDSSIES